MEVGWKVNKSSAAYCSEFSLIFCYHVIICSAIDGTRHLSYNFFIQRLWFFKCHTSKTIEELIIIHIWHNKFFSAIFCILTIEIFLSFSKLILNDNFFYIEWSSSRSMDIEHFKFFNVVHELFKLEIAIIILIIQTVDLPKSVYRIVNSKEFIDNIKLIFATWIAGVNFFYSLMIFDILWNL